MVQLNAYYVNVNEAPNYIAKLVQLVQNEAAVQEPPLMLEQTARKQLLSQQEQTQETLVRIQAQDTLALLQELVARMQGMLVLRHEILVVVMLVQDTQGRLQDMQKQKLEVEMQDKQKLLQETQVERLVTQELLQETQVKMRVRLVQQHVSILLH